MSGSWSGGYVTDIEYTRHYYLTQSPQLMALACLINGVAVDPPWAAPRLHYLELGCGRGLNACTLAAANPGWRVTAIDVTPSAIADARRLADEAGLDNVRFIEADLAVFAESAEAAALPPVDAISAHGVWSWVPAPVRAGMVRLAAAKLRAGGMMHVSYNALPAQAGMLAIQRVLREAGRRLAGRSDRQVTAGMEVIAALSAARAAQIGATEAARETLEQLPQRPVAYLAHEYMNASWTPFWHADVAAALAEARLDYAGSARLVENFPDLMLTAEQRAVADRFDDPMMRELVTDTCVTRTLRHDVYVRGAARLPNGERDAILGAVTLALAIPPEEVRYVLRLPAGDATLNADTYGPMVQALAAGPRRIGELIALREGGAGRLSPGEVAMAMVGTSQALVVSDAAAGPSARLHRFNAAVARRDVRLDDLNGPSVLASLRLGSGVTVRGVDALLVARIAADGAEPDPAALAGALAPHAPEEMRARLGEVLATVLRERRETWRRLGVV